MPDNTINKTYALILAGGFGTRFWPLSRQLEPKHLLKFYKEQSLLQETIKRIIPLITPERIYIITNSAHKFEVVSQISVFGIPEKNIILEPESKNTAPAIGLAAIHIIKKDPGSVLLILPADHHIANEAKLRALIKEGVAAASGGYLVTLGIKPTEPAIRYGYIKIKSKISAEGGSASGGKNTKYYKVEKFTEKPDLQTAKKFIKDKHYLWNSGMFIVQSEVILAEIKKYLPKLYAGIRKINIADDFRNIYAGLASVSIDYGVLERSKRTVVIPALNLGWDDLGAWSAINSLIPKDKSGNIIQGNSIDIDSRDITVIGKNHLISTIGLKDVIIVDTADALLVCAKNRSEDVKKMVELVKKKGGYEHFASHTVKRPWGTYTVINNGHGYKVKLIELLPHKRLSLQRHKLRSEHWVVVEGTAKVTHEGKERLVYSNESIFVSAGHTHRLENPQGTPLKIVEVQSGSYLEEDDIERLDDDFKRL